MNYFKGSRRKVRQRKSLINSSNSVALETGNTSTGHQVADLPNVDKVQRRSRDSDKTETTQKKMSRDTEKAERTISERSRDSDKTERTLRKRSRDSENTESVQQKISSDLEKAERTQWKRSRDSEKTESVQQKISSDLEKAERTQRKRSRDSENTESVQQKISSDLEKAVRTKRKRSRDSEKTESETNITIESNKRKAQHSTSNSHHKVSSVHTQRAKNKSTRKATTKGGESASSMVHEAAEQSNNQPDQSGYLSTSESDGNLDLSDKRDSLILCDANEQQSDRNFLQQQIKTLKAPFQLEEDCPALAKIRANDSKHIPLEVIQNTLRKVNHKTEDEILRNLNRPAQRKLLSNLEGTRYKNDVVGSTCVSDQQLLERYEEIQTRVTNLENVHSKFQHEHAQHKHIDVLLSQLEAVSEEINGKTLNQEVIRTNTVNLVGVNNGLSLSDNTPITHQQLVQILFKD